MKRCGFCKKPIPGNQRYCSKECIRMEAKTRVESYRKSINNIRQKMHITGSAGAQEKRKCYNCGKEFISNTTKFLGKKLVVAGEYTCCWQCTQELIEKGEF